MLIDFSPYVGDFLSKEDVLVKCCTKMSDLYGARCFLSE
jgi:uncharacterized protein YhbP (UPF0306 family)